MRNWDLAMSVVVSTILMAIIFILPEAGYVRVALGLLFVLFLPGYALISALFPKKEDLDGIERLALSFGLSIAVVPLIGLGLNYTPFGIRLIPIAVSVYIFIVIFSIVALIRRRMLFPEESFHIPLRDFFTSLREDFSYSSRLDKFLTVVLVIAILAAIGMLVYVIITPKEGEHFTEFYILGPDGKAAGYPHNLTVGEKASVIIGIVNHEYRPVNYVVEIWLVNATFENNTTVVNHMYFIDSFNVSLNHTPVTIEGNWTPQWEMLYNFSINRTGQYKLWFLLFKDYAPPLPAMEDYAGSEVQQRIIDAVEGKIQSLNLNLVIREKD